MIQNEEIKKLKLEIEFLKNQIYILSINIENTIKNIAFAVDKQDQKLLNLIFEIDNDNRKDTSNALQNISKHQEFSLHNSKNKIDFEVNNLKKDLSLFKENSNISLIYHDSIYKELENYLTKKIPKEEINANDIDHILFETYKIERNKIRKYNNKTVSITLPTYIRHYFHHINNDKNEDPTIEEIRDSISLILDILKKEN